jgi:hypothetical protein
MGNKASKGSNFDIEISLKEGKEWSDDKLAKVKAFVKKHSDKRSPERKIKSELLTIKYQMEEYVYAG